ncbi:hypothetical protein [Sagittula sp. P11]|uniref:hypothetical protein n=1 Tax=Sagittula sp. P11 TaxID=2009329 RepID=UPI0012FE30DA|nr:hypothetical protein [Sagittula sp. P11]
MTYSLSPQNGTHDLLARITRDQAAKQSAFAHAAPASPKIATAVPSTKKRNRKQAPQSVAKMAKPKKPEPNTTTITNSDGTTSYRVQLRGRVHGKMHSLCRTFSSLTTARAWRKRMVAEIELNGFPVSTAKTLAPMVADILKARLEKDQKIERSTRQYLQYLSEHPTWQMTKCSDLTVDSIMTFAETLVSEGRAPQTAAGYMAIFSTTLQRARRRGSPIPPQVVDDAMALLWETDTIARSQQRDRRPTLEELDRVLTAVTSNKRQKLPVATIVVFAIYSTRRIDEICHLQWDDLNEAENTILVRDMKHPRKKRGNNVTVDLTPEVTCHGIFPPPSIRVRLTCH